MTPLIGSFAGVLLGWAMGLLSVFLVLLVLVQRGRGGGLTGALGGPGGQSAFGTKAGDMFTKITSFTALGWIALCAYTMWLLGAHPTASVTPPPPHVEATPADATQFDAGGLVNPPSGGLSEPADDALVPGGALTPADDQAAPDEEAAPADTPTDTAAPTDTAVPAAVPAGEAAPAEEAGPAEEANP